MMPRGLLPVRIFPFLLLVPLAAWGLSAAWQTRLANRTALAQQPTNRIDPASWGSDHAGKPVPDYMTGDECLFCHRKKVGPSWSGNVHQTTIRLLEKKDAGRKKLAGNPGTSEMVKMIEFILGGENHSRYLRRGAGYGKLDMLSVGWHVDGGDGSGKLVHAEKPAWNGAVFGRACAGCHSTGVDSKKQTFSAISIDCFACHGNVELAHTKDTGLVHLSKKRADPPRVVASICGQCHIRSGMSRSTGRPFANNFIAGDNLFRDLEVDLAPAKIATLNPGDRHVMQNIREMVLQQEAGTTCLSCHDVHGQSTDRHQEMEEQDLCLTCHYPRGPRSSVKPYRRQGSTCGY